MDKRQNITVSKDIWHAQSKQIREKSRKTITGCADSGNPITALGDQSKNVLHLCYDNDK